MSYGLYLLSHTLRLEKSTVLQFHIIIIIEHVEYQFISQEMLAYGICHGVGSFFGSFGGAAAPPRVMVLVSVK